MRRVLFMVCALLSSGCVVAQHPLVRALSPTNIVMTVANATSVRAQVNAQAKLPLLPPGIVAVESDGVTTIITIRPPVDIERLAYLKRDAEARGQRVMVVEQKKGDGK